MFVTCNGDNKRILMTYTVAFHFRIFLCIWWENTRDTQIMS